MAPDPARHGPPNDQRRKPPPLPARLVDIRPALVILTSLWFLAFCGLLVAWLAFGSKWTVWLSTCLAGWVLGLIGFGILAWQRAAARRGSRTAQRL